MSANPLISQMRVVERPCICRALDYPAYCPILGGIPAATVRITFSLAATCIATCGEMFNCCNSGGNYSFATNYLQDETMRGWLECTGTSYIFDRSRAKEEESNGIITNACGAYGRYICKGFVPTNQQNIHKIGEISRLDLVYSMGDHRAKDVRWTIKRNCSEDLDTYGHLTTPPDTVMDADA